MIVPADDDPSIITELGKNSFYLPTSFITAQLSTILGFWIFDISHKFFRKN
jgi:hypothetical protein